jgi:hypothetical protein
MVECANLPTEVVGVGVLLGNIGLICLPTFDKRHPRLEVNSFLGIAYLASCPN